MSSPTSSAKPDSAAELVGADSAAADSATGPAAPVEIRAGASTYEAWVGGALLERLPDLVSRAGLHGRSRIVADRAVWDAYGAVIEQAFRDAEREAPVYATAGGEEQKTLAGAERVYNWLLDVGTDRGDHVIAVGGGVVGDMAGFVAATLMRGIPVVQVPTTLLAQVDSSIGGKAGVNHKLGKNLIGAFHQPSLVVADTRVLRTLPEREYRAGWAEIIKMAMILDAELFERLEARAEALLAFENQAVLAHAIRRSIELKGGVVGSDERESGQRVVLNYGHTIGHALEAATGYGRLLHGEAVAIGMGGAGSIANRRGLLSDDAFARQSRLLERFGLPRRAPDVRAADLLGPLSRDKKARGKTLQWILADGIGSVTTARDVTADEVTAALSYVGCD